MSNAFCKSTNIPHPRYPLPKAWLIFSVRLIKAWEAEIFFIFSTDKREIGR